MGHKPAFYNANHKVVDTVALYRYFLRSQNSGMLRWNFCDDIKPGEARWTIV